jgi:hypothetical protein
MPLSFPAPAIAPQTLTAALQTQGFAVLQAQDAAVLAGAALPDWQAWEYCWNDLPHDNYLLDGGRYRRRRHASFVVEGDQASQMPQRPHWQPVQYNALHGGMERHFEPMAAEIASAPAWHQLLVWLGREASALKGAQPWYVEAHQFRIDTTDGIGRPTPEGAHRDGVDLVAVFLVGRDGIKGGETRVFDAAGPNGQRFTLSQPWSLLLLDDARVIHESTPIQPIAAHGHRDTLVVTLRAGGFQNSGR